MYEWKLKRPYLCAACLLAPSTDELFDVDPGQLAPPFDYVGPHGAWQIYQYDRSGRSFTLALYRYRVLILYQPPHLSSVGTDDAIRRIFLPVYEQDVHEILSLVKEELKGSLRDVFSYPFVVAPDFDKVALESTAAGKLDGLGWLDDGATTHFYRIFDSRKNRVGFVRVSKWLAISYGLNDDINREIVNLIYERILHELRRRGSDAVSMGEDEIGLLEGLSRFTVPTELTLFAQRLGMRVAVFVASIGLLLAIAQRVTAEAATLAAVLAYTVIVLFAPALWMLTRTLVPFRP